MNGMQSLVSMNPIYRKEKEVSSKEKSVTFNERNMKFYLNVKGVWYMSKIYYKIHNSYPPAMRGNFCVNAIYFSLKCKLKHAPPTN
jgi:hypothetical protein